MAAAIKVKQNLLKAMHVKISNIGILQNFSLDMISQSIDINTKRVFIAVISFYFGKLIFLYRIVYINFHKSC